MTKEAFDNQKWYKNMPVWANGQKCYVHAVHFLTGKIDVIYNIGDASSVAWNLCMVETKPPKPTALDLIAQEREKQISKGYTVEHDAAYTERTGINYADITARLAGFRPICPPEWDQAYWDKLCELDRIDRIRIAATWMARELERLLFIQNKEA